MTTKAGQPWTEKSDAELMRLKSEGHSAAGISIRMGRSRSSIQWRAGKLGAKFEPDGRWTEQQDVELRCHCKQGLSAEEIAIRMRKSSGAVYEHAGTLDDCPRPHREERKAQNKGVVDEALLGLVSLATHRLPLARMYEAFL